MVSSPKLKEPEGYVRCKNCSRKAKDSCDHQRCVTCCEKLGEFCKGHDKLIQLRKEEEQLLNNKRSFDLVMGKKIEKGDLPEENFEVYGDTVTIFCLQDFLSNRSFSKETLELCHRSNRAKNFRSHPAIRDRNAKRLDRKTRWQQKHEELLGSLPSMEGETQRDILNAYGQS